MYHPENYTLAAKLFLHSLGFIYFVALFPFLFQIKGLIGKEGILPASRYLQFIYSRMGKKAYFHYPTIFFINSSDAMLVGTVWLGLLLSILLFLGIVPSLVLPLLYMLYLSIIRVGQDFLSFGWELFLLEITVNAFLLSLTTTPNPFVWISINFLLFRFHLQAGAVKLQSKDKSWQTLTGLCYHYHTQPLPNTIAWYADKLPHFLQKLSCLIMLGIEIVVPFGVFGGEELRLIVFICFFALQFFIWFTGNLSYLNYLTVCLSVILLSNHYFPFSLFTPSPDAHSPLLLTLFASIGGITLFTLQLIKLWDHFLPNSLFRTLFNKFYNFFIVNRYGIFAVMTTKRCEIVVEGSEDGKEWKEYLFPYKPSETNRRPRRISPYQPRLDWQAWFLPFSSYENAPWFQNFLHKLLLNSPTVLSLLRENPFQDHPPKYVRAIVYDYTFTSFAKKRETGCWWERRFIGNYSPTLSLSRKK